MSTIVEAAAGKLEGTREGRLVVFRGVPFGQVPQRWAPAQPPTPWAGVRPAHTFGPWAPQIGGDVLFQIKPHATAEDCLQLNVWTPALDACRRPVLVWIHGGGFTNGSGTSPVHDGAHLARDGDVVVVTLNYRLGALGFLRLTDVTEGRVPSTGNEGLEDQRLALRWVAENIERFGGDPDNVTLFGESAGAVSVGCHLAMPRSASLFHKAIAQSGAGHGTSQVDHANAFALRTLEAMQVSPDDARELRQAPLARILDAQKRVLAGRARVPGRRGMAYGPNVDGKVLEQHPLSAALAGSAAGKPLIVGTNLEEWKLFAYVRPSEMAMTDERLSRRLARYVGPDRVREILDTYGRGLSERGKRVTPFELSCAIQTDRLFRIPAIRLADAQRQHTERVFAYRFDWPSALGRMGACHALELAFVFGTHALPGSLRFCGQGPAADRLSTEMRRAWTEFAHTGAPGGWAPYTAQRATLIFDDPAPRTEHDPQRAERLAWEGELDAIGEL